MQISIDINVHDKTLILTGDNEIKLEKEAINFKNFIESYYHIPVVIGTHPIPQKYYIEHKALNTWNSKEWQEMIKPTLCSEEVRKRYD
jgi:hypothetical protein